MAQVAANMAGLSGPFQIIRAQNMVTKCTGNANVPGLQPSPLDVQDSITTAQTAIQTVNAAKQATREAVAAKKAALKNMVVQVMLMGASVESITGGDSTKILTTGYDIKQTPVDGGPIPDVAPVIILGFKPTANQGELALKVKPVANKLVYEVQVTTTPNDQASWKQHLLESRASMLLKGLVSGTHVYVRVRALMANGPGPWSVTDAHSTVP